MCNQGKPSQTQQKERGKKMRVTKLTRDYVEKRVKEQFPKTAEEFAWEVEQDKMHKAFEEADELMKTYAELVVKQLNEKYELKGYCLGTYHNYSYVTDTYSSDSEIYWASVKAKEARIKKMNETIENILVSLELGGTKADLDEMLANIEK
jgi:hypothetical protein